MSFRLAKKRRPPIDYHCALKIIEGIAYSEETEWESEGCGTDERKADVSGYQVQYGTGQLQQPK
jgi:hypothetical protein